MAAVDLCHSNLYRIALAEVHAAPGKENPERDRKLRMKSGFHLTYELNAFRFVCSTPSIFPSGKQFTTSSLVSHPLRAMPIPNHKSCKRSLR
jgi:hypothetical protein